MNGNRYSGEEDGPVSAGSFVGYAEDSPGAEFQRRKSLHHRTPGALTASQSSRPIAASMNSLHELSSEALEAVSRLEERLSPVLHAPSPEKEVNGCGHASTCSLHDELISVSRRIEDTIGRVNRLMARLAL